MKREIKFRVWDDGVMIYVGNGMDFLLSFGNDKPSLAMFSQGGEFCEEHPVENVMQFTGLTDKNGKDIYEGDIISFPSGTSTAVKIMHEGEEMVVYKKNPDNNGIISFMEGYFAVGTKDAPKYYGCLTRSGNLKHYEIEVIGNIYEGEKD